VRAPPGEPAERDPGGGDAPRSQRRWGENEWARHPRATLYKIEAEVDVRMGAGRSRLLEVAATVKQVAEGSPVVIGRASLCLYSSRVRTILFIPRVSWPLPP